MSSMAVDHNIHPLFVRVWHWINAVAIIIMIMSGWRIYNAAPIFPFIHFPNWMTLGGWLGGALQWHFAAMWLLVLNFGIYVIWGLITVHFQRKMLPIRPVELIHDFKQALGFKLDHDGPGYNAVQRFAYVGVLSAIVLTVLSGIAIWKPVQFREIAWIMGGYEGARSVHFLGMTAICAFLIVHLALVVLVPRTFLPMITGRDKRRQGGAVLSDRSAQS
jgi:thiosulfate reductase cytochrome b subunit